ncbi:hypothetical protein ACFPOI_10070 [Nonomuraea angiospora]|uniref:Integrase catalytic domain-containing protein n=1 Tax=Nonomuraea angiospora TaxID=46172 RepID=A0ABR9M9Z3_9ACTN|nr:hypothetical protein [Nonomuraea angiospora]
MPNTKNACELTGISRAPLHSAAHPRPRPAGPPAPRPTPPDALSRAERHEVLETLNSYRFIDKAPRVWATLLDEGVYLCSISTMYRLLRAEDGVRERRAQARHPPKTVPELLADVPTACGPGTSPNPAVRATRSSTSTAATSSAGWCSDFPGFGSVEDARLFCQEFYAWYNHEHHHSGVGCHRPVDVHYGRAVAVRDRWAVILAAAQAAHPGRHATGGTPTPPDLSGPGWINKPKNENQKDTTEKPTQN